jgi:hypothetical protein
VDDPAQAGTATYKPKGAKKPNQGNADVSGKVLLKSVDQLSPEEYEKNRVAILREARTVPYGAEAE